MYELYESMIAVRAAT